MNCQPLIDIARSLLVMALPGLGCPHQDSVNAVQAAYGIGMEPA